ncbi:four helix bundle protein [Tenacibaculum sp.]|uniref:four helix bundle protein n=1 Tax=Tenacibaculum sp. TaxID=1906242 RepID=UPI003AA9B827
MKIYSFEKLEVWKESISLTKNVYSLTDSFPINENFGLTSQLRRATVSIASNLAEGTARFITISYSSAMEVLNQLIISRELSYISEKDYILVKKS